jgi:hypothetical protein
MRLTRGIARCVVIGVAIGSLATPIAAQASVGPFADAGHDARGIPHYDRRTFSSEERSLLRRVYGVEDPARLYVSDSTEDGLVKYDTQVKRCLTCYVNSYTLGFVSIRRPGESWEALERRVRTMRSRDFPPQVQRRGSSLDGLDPDVRGHVERMLADARRAGFTLRVNVTYRSPEREALLMSRGRGVTHTLTSLHSYGRAIDIVVRDGNLGHSATRKEWVAFRRWVTAYQGGTFRILGSPEQTFDWPHVEMPSPAIGFRTVDAAIARARACTGRSASRPLCDFAPHLAASR